MSNEYVTVRNLVTRQVGLVRRRIAEHAIFGKCLEIVPEGTKSHVSLRDKVDEFLGRKQADKTHENFKPEEDDYETEEA